MLRVCSPRTLWLNVLSMNILLLGRGKTGSLVAEVARQRGHQIHIAGATENADLAALTPEKLRDIEVVIDFTTPHCVIPHIEACVASRQEHGRRHDRMVRRTRSHQGFG